MSKAKKKASKKKASKKRAAKSTRAPRAKKRTTKKRTTKKKTTKRRTKAQILATKKLVALNRLRRAKRRRFSPRKKSQASWTKWAAAQPERRDTEGRLMYQGPMTASQDAAMRRAMKAMGLKDAEVYRGEKGELVLQAGLTKKQERKFRRAKKPRRTKHGPRRGFVGPLPPGAHAQAVAHKKKFGVKYEKLRQQYFKAKQKAPTTAVGILKKARSAAKYSKLTPIMNQKLNKNAALWVCGNPLGKRTGCGGGISKRRGSRVVGILA